MFNGEFYALRWLLGDNWDMLGKQYLKIKRHDNVIDYKYRVNLAQNIWCF